MAWQAAAAAGAMALMQKIAAEKAAMGQEFQEGFAEAESGGMDIGEQPRPGMGTLKSQSVIGNFIKNYLQSYGQAKYAEWRGGGGISPTIAKDVMSQNKFEGMLKDKLPPVSPMEPMKPLTDKTLSFSGSQIPSEQFKGMLINKALEQIGVGQWFRDSFSQRK